MKNRQLKLGKVIICWLAYLPLIGPKLPFLSIFSLTYLYVPLVTYIWLYLGLITLIWAYLPLIALILAYVPYSPYTCICILLLRLHLCAIGPLFMEILHLKDLRDTSVVTECSLGVNLVIDDYYMYAFLRIWGIQVSFGRERSCSSARRVSNFNSNVPLGVSTLIFYIKYIKFERDPLNTFRVRMFTS